MLDKGRRTEKRETLDDKDVKNEKFYKHDIMCEDFWN